MAIGKNTVIILSIFLISKFITFAWSNSHSNNIHSLYKRDELLIETENKVFICQEIKSRMSLIRKPYSAMT